MVRDLLESNAFGMVEEKKIEGLGEWSELYLKVVVIGKENAEIRGDDKATKLLMGNEVLADGTRAYTSMAQGLETFIYLIENVDGIFIKYLSIFRIWGEIEFGIFGNL